MLAPRWAHAPLSGEGAARHGGRWNPRGVPALYMSEECSTAIAEYEQELGIRPGTLCAYEVEAELVGLLDTAVQAELDAPSGLLLGAWKRTLLIEGARPVTWALAERLIAAGVAGARVPSAQAAGGANLVLWRWNVPGGARVAALDPLGDLPRDQSSWPQ